MSTAKDFRFGHGQRVKLTESAETGRVMGRADYSNSEEGYLVLYVDGTGCQRQEWITSSALENAPAKNSRARKRN